MYVPFRFTIQWPLTMPMNSVMQPLPPTHEVHLSGVPGFRATIDYSVTVYVHKAKSASLLLIKNKCVRDF